MILGPNQEKWLKDLETTTEPQGRGVLKSSAGYCCLGRACVIFGYVEGRNADGVITFDGESKVLPRTLQDKLQLRNPNGMPGSVPIEYTLTKMNDQGKSFKEIAAAIREHPEWYFTESA